jgi:inorganic triphosphatase YgiF
MAQFEILAQSEIAAGTMSSPKEIELKLEVPPASLPGLGKIPSVRALADHPDTETEISVYFDTDKQKLRRHGLTLRVRRTGKRLLQTIKATAAGAFLERDEWEEEVPSETPDLSLARGTALEPLLSRKLGQKLKPLFETKVRRTSCSLSDESRAVAVTLDKGRIHTGERSQPLCEIELELKRGPSRTLFDLARELVDALPAQLAVKSKSERGYALIDRVDGAAPVKAAPVELCRKMPARDGFRAIARACLRQIVGNVPALRAGDGEGVHQMRVGLRRLRAAISLFGDILDGRETAAVKRELKWLTQELGPARQLEVLMRRVVEPIKRRRGKANGISSIAQDIERQRAEALARAQAAVGSARFRRLLIEVAAWMETGQWMSPEDDLMRDRVEMPVAAFAAGELEGRWRKLRKRCKAVRELGAHRRHKLRIQGKKLRYASEFFASLFPGRKAVRRRKAVLAKLETMQDCLGDLNDIVAHEDLIAASVRPGGRVNRRRASGNRAFAAGLLAGREDARFDAVLTRASEACASLAKAKPFW